MNKFTYYVSKAINGLFFYNFLGTSYGILVGVLLLSLQDVFALLYPPIGLIKEPGFLAFGIVVFNIKFMIKKKYEDPNIEVKLKYIREMIEEGNFSESEKRRIWRNAINTIILEYSQNADPTNNNADSHNPRSE